MKIVVAAGGTGGHLYPAVTLAKAFMQFESDTQILFIGTASGIEAKLVPEYGFAFACISAKGYVGKGLVKKAFALLLVAVGFFQSLCLLIRFSPQLVIGIGGYAAFPVLLAALTLKTKRVILEPNVVPGLSNRLLASYVDLVVIAFEESRAYFQTEKIRCLGSPVRQEILQASRTSSDRAMKTLLVLGGSQGSHAINRAMIGALPRLLSQSLRVIHQTGSKDFDEVAAAYDRVGLSGQVSPFISEMAEAYAAADLVVCRAGAGTLSELAAVGKPSLLIPFPYAGGHQEKNAACFVSAGAAEMIKDQELDGPVLAERILLLLLDPERLATMGDAARRRGHPRSAEEIVKVCDQLVRGINHDQNQGGRP